MIKKTLKILDNSIKNFKQGKVSKPINLSIKVKIKKGKLK